MAAIHQFLASLSPRDAQSQHHLAIRDALRSAGYASEIYTGEAKGALRSVGRPFQSFEGGPDTWMLYAHAIGTPVADFVLQRGEPLMLNYHNITPSSFFEPWEPVAAIRLAAGRRQLRPLVARAQANLADSQYNARELLALGARRCSVVPIMLDPDNFAVEPDASTVAQLRARSTSSDTVRLLFVGRLAPNKCQHELVAALPALRSRGLSAELHLVGGSSSDRYERTLREYVKALDLHDVVHFVGSASPEVLAAHYAACDVFVCVSEHEGFCVPLLEAWHHGLPIVAYAGSAVGETLGGGGISLSRKSPTVLAAAISRLVEDPALVEELRQRGHDRLADFDPGRSRAALLTAVEAAVA